MEPSGDALARKAIETHAMAAAMPFNATKPGEHGFEQGVAPQPGATVEPGSDLVGASTLSEAEPSNPKTGSRATRA